MLDLCRRLRLCVLAATVMAVVSARAESLSLAPIPHEYPTACISDSFTETPFASDFAERRKAYIAFVLQNPGNGIFSETVRLSQGVLPLESCMGTALDDINSRKDCSDFRMNGLLRVMCQFGDSGLLSQAFKVQAKESILGYKYWPDEPGIDSMCSWSENHYIMFAVAGYIAGKLYPDEVFTNSGRTGAEQAERFRPRILKWMNLRFKIGFSEWLSNVYYNEDFPPLLNLVDFADDDELSERAVILVDLLLADMALNSFHGVFGSTQGRTYEAEKKWAARAHVGSVSKLAFGTNVFTVDNMSATFLAISPTYRPPQVVFEMANENETAVVNRQRMGLNVADAPKFGLSYDCLEDGMHFFTMEAYAHPSVFPLTLKMFDTYRWWQNDFFKPFAEQRALVERAQRLGVLPLALWWYRHDLQRNLRSEANLYTYRTPAYMLSTAQDHRAGFGGDQQHVWQATLGPDTVCFTTHPAKKDGPSPNYWTGAGNLPRAGQIENVAIVLHRMSNRPGLYVNHALEFTHAWLPKDQFDEFLERGAWKFARSGESYLALWSQQPTYWQMEPGEDQHRELIALGKRNIWICELGSADECGSFERFMARIEGAHIWSRGLNVAYRSPSQGLLEFGWRQSLRQGGKPVHLDDYPRYGNPFATAPFPAAEITLGCNGETLYLNWDTRERTASTLMGVE